MCERCNSRELNPAWDSLLTDEEREMLLRPDLKCSVNVQTLDPIVVKELAKIVSEWLQEVEGKEMSTG